MKKLFLSLTILFLLTTQSCRTTKTDYSKQFPPQPQRQELKTPETLKDYVDIINYYDHLVSEWEAWGETVSAMIDE
jgi:hypothetical protein